MKAGRKSEKRMKRVRTSLKNVAKLYVMYEAWTFEEIENQNLTLCYETFQSFLEVLVFQAV